MTVVLLFIVSMALTVIATTAVAVAIVVVRKGAAPLITQIPIPDGGAEIIEVTGSDLVLAKMDILSDQLGKIMEILVKILEEEQKGNAWIESQMSELGVGPGTKPPRTAAAARRAPRKRKLPGAGSPAGEG